jgi:molybdopterin-synthase adenylyltransferase
MMELRFQDGDASRIIAELVGRETERCSVLWASHVALPELDRLVVSRIEFPADDNYSDRSLISAQLKPDYIAQIGKRAARENLSAIFVHSHPGAAPPEFSEIDDDGETHLARFMSVRAPHTAQGAGAPGGWVKRLPCVPCRSGRDCRCYSTPMARQVPRR